jgi:hypothetical protein
LSASKGVTRDQIDWPRSGRELFFINRTSIMAVSVQLTPTFNAGNPAKLFDAPSMLLDGPLIDAYNETAKTPIDRSLVALRDTVAHGRILAKDDASQHFVLVKFTKPDGRGVSVETSYELTFDWMNDQIARVGDTLDLVKARYRELKVSP